MVLRSRRMDWKKEPKNEWIIVTRVNLSDKYDILSVVSSPQLSSSHH